MRNVITSPFAILSLIITFIPYSLLSNTTSLSTTGLLILALTCLQSIAIYCIFIARKTTLSKSLKLFWQYLLLATIGGLIANISHFLFPSLNLFQDFLSLFSYFFIILAIETNPHLNETPINKYIGGRIPAIFFCVVSFSYFVILPYEFSELSYETQLPSVFFHLLITGLICVRLIICFGMANLKYWRYVYGFLFLGALAIFLVNISDFLQINNQEELLSSHNALMQLFPYFALIMSAKISIQQLNPPISKQYETHAELYTLLLVICLLFLHFIGIEYRLLYNTPSYWQSVVIFGTLFSSTLFISFLTLKKRKVYNLLKQNYQHAISTQDSLRSHNKELNKSLIYSENKAIVNTSNNAILTVSTIGKILSANPSAVQVFQFLEQDLVGANVSSLFSQEDKMHYFFEYNSNVFALQRKDKGLSLECKAIRSDQSEFPVQVELQWADRQESPLIVITFINLTARKLAEQQALELKDKFIANISHEFRTPLTIINGVLDRYLDHTESPEESQELTTAKRNGLRLVRMVEQLLELSRLNDNPKLSFATYRLETLMSMPSDSFKRLAKQSHLSFLIDIPPDLWLECDAQAFEKIIFNLLANAIKYTPAGGEISVNAYQEKDTIILDVIDTGIGINKESQSKIFERFQRAEDQKNQSIFGVGIGLSLVNELVKAHHWRISLASEYNQGSKFSLYIPLAKPVEVESTLPHRMSEEELSSLLIEQNSTSNKVNNDNQQVVLIIEDNLDMQSHIKQVVEQAHHCMIAS
ncbi:MAG: PAS domain S-box protein, partial [Colwelliaceae bacterium]|nr:PAS domain S-box protein [Colwelliaceae bacterium]